MRVIITETSPAGRVWSHTTRTLDRGVALRRAIKARFGAGASLNGGGDVVAPWTGNVLARKVRIDFAP